MNFSEQLDKFVERGAESFDALANDTGNDDRYLLTPENMHLAGAASLKPIVLKLVEALKKIQSGEDEIEIAPDNKINRFSRVDMCAIADMALAEIEQMIGGGK